MLGTIALLLFLAFAQVSYGQASASPPSPSPGATVMTDYKDSLVIFGDGIPVDTNQVDQSSNALWLFSTTTRRWTSLCPSRSFPAPIFRTACGAVVDDYLYLTGEYVASAEQKNEFPLWRYNLLDQPCKRSSWTNMTGQVRIVTARAFGNSSQPVANMFRECSAAFFADAQSGVKGVAVAGGYRAPDTDRLYLVIPEASGGVRVEATRTIIRGDSDEDNAYSRGMASNSESIFLAGGYYWDTDVERDILLTRQMQVIPIRDSNGNLTSNSWTAWKVDEPTADNFTSSQWKRRNPCVGSGFGTSAFIVFGGATISGNEFCQRGTYQCRDVVRVETRSGEMRLSTVRVANVTSWLLSTQPNTHIKCATIGSITYVTYRPADDSAQVKAIFNSTGLIALDYTDTNNVKFVTVPLGPPPSILTSVPVIAGGAAAAVVVLIAIGLGVFFWKRSKRTKAPASNEEVLVVAEKFAVDASRTCHNHKITVHHCFISYRVKSDKATAALLQKEIEDLRPSLLTFIDSKCLNYSRSYVEEFQDFLRRSRMVIFLLSDASIAVMRENLRNGVTDNVLIEIATGIDATHNGGPILVPVLLGHYDEQGRLSRFNSFRTDDLPETPLIHGRGPRQLLTELFSLNGFHADPAADRIQQIADKIGEIYRSLQPQVVPGSVVGSAAPGRQNSVLGLFYGNKN